MLSQDRVHRIRLEEQGRGHCNIYISDVHPDDQIDTGLERHKTEGRVALRTYAVSDDGNLKAEQFIRGKTQVTYLRNTGKSSF